METTDLDSAVEQLLSPAPEQEGDDNLQEIAEDMVEVEEDDDDVIDDEDVDELEASDEEYDDADFVTEDEAEGTEENNFFTVKIDGKEENWTLDQLKQSAAGQGAINNRFQEIAQVRKQLEAQQAEIAQREQYVTQLFEQAQQGFMAPPKMPDQSLAEDDPIAYMQQRAQYDADVQAYNQQVAQINQLRQQQQKQTAEQEQRYVAEQAEIIRTKIPELADPEKGKSHWEALMNVGREYGFSDQEIAATQDARYIEMANDAMKYRRIVANRKKAEAKSKAARPVVKAGAKKVADPKGTARRKQQQKLQKSGRIEDALGLMFKG